MVKAESETGKVTVMGKVDPTKVRDNLAEKIKRKVELVSPQPKKENKDTEPNNKSEKKTDDKKPKDKEVILITGPRPPPTLGSIIIITFSLPLPAWDFSFFSPNLFVLN